MLPWVLLCAEEAQSKFTALPYAWYTGEGMHVRLEHCLTHGAQKVVCTLLFYVLDVLE